MLFNFAIAVPSLNHETVNWPKALRGNMIELLENLYRIEHWLFHRVKIDCWPLAGELVCALSDRLQIWLEEQVPSVGSYVRRDGKPAERLCRNRRYLPIKACLRMTKPGHRLVIINTHSFLKWDAELGNAISNLASSNSKNFCSASLITARFIQNSR